MALLLTVVPPSVGIASATAHATEQLADEEPAEPSGPGWGKILGACCGVLFGGALALWQIRGMKNRR